MITNTQIANITQLSLTCKAQSVTRSIADSMDNYIPADHFQLLQEKLSSNDGPSWGGVLANRDR